MMQFDAVVGNPPYKKGLHIELFNLSFDILKDNGSMIIVHPSTPFINRRPVRESNSTKTIKRIVREYESEIRLLNGKGEFGAELWVPVSITWVRKRSLDGIRIIYAHRDRSVNKIHHYTTFDDVFIHGNDIVLSIRDKVFNKMNDTVHSHLFRFGSRGKQYFKLNGRLSGTKPDGIKIFPDFYQLICRKDEIDPFRLMSDYLDDTNEDTLLSNWVALNSPEQVRNFHRYVLTKFVRFCVSLYKINQQLMSGELKAVPWMDFNRSWTDEELFDHFGLTTEEREYINRFIPNLYKRDQLKQ